MIFIPADSHAKRYAAHFGELLSRQHLRDKVTVISKPHQQHPKGKNAVFLVSSAEQLRKWDYDYSSVFYVADCETESRFGFDYTLGTHVHHTTRCSGAERARRIAVVGSSRIGRYACLSAEVAPNPHYLDTASQLPTYILQMVEFGLGEKL